MAEYDTSGGSLINCTNAAVDKISEILQDESNDTVLRIFVQGGGCSGFSYGFHIDSERTEDDFICDFGAGVTVVVDPISAQYLGGCTVDYSENDIGSSFTIINPNATTTCGCGSSFSPF